MTECRMFAVCVCVCSSYCDCVPEDQVEPDPQAAAGGEGHPGGAGSHAAVPGGRSEPRRAQTRGEGAHPAEQPLCPREGAQVSTAYLPFRNSSH